MTAPEMSPSSGQSVFAGLGEKLRELDSVVASQADRFAATLDIARAIGSTLDLDEILRLVIQLVTRLVACERATLFLVDRDRHEIWSKIALGDGVAEIRQSIDVGIAGFVARTGEPALVPEAATDPRFNPRVDERTGFVTRNVLAAPMRDKAGQVTGIVEALNHQGGPFGTDDLELLVAIAAQTAVAVENARLFAEVVQRNRDLSETQAALRAAVAELDVLYSIEKEMSAAGSFQELLDIIIGRTMALVEAEAGSILLTDESTGHLRFRSAAGPKGDAVRDLELLPGQGIAGHVAVTGEAIVTNDAPTHAAFDASVARRIRFETRSVLCVPIATHVGPIGALELLNKRAGQSFNAGDERIATLVAGQAARAITIGREREEGERRARLAAIGQALSGMMHDLRTPLTIVSGYAQMLAEDIPKDQRTSACEIVQRQVDHIDAMVRETLAFARGERELLVRRVHVNRFLDEVALHLAKSFEGRNIELVLAGTYRGVAFFDEVKLRRAVYNIARNAADAMPDGGRFTLAVDKEGGEIVFRFADTGKGIPDAIAGSLFKSFVSYGKSEGTGLGLAMVKTVADQHGGRVDFVSEPGKGTTFTLRVADQVPPGAKA